MGPSQVLPLGQSRSGINRTEGVLHSPQSSKTRALLPDAV